MANTKISALTSATTPLAGTEVLPIVQSGSTVKVAVSDLTTGRAVSAASLALTGSPLPTTSGGTGLTSFTANSIVYASSTSVLTTGSALKFDGNNVGVGITPNSWGGNYKAIQLGAGAAVWQYNGVSAGLSQNFYDSGAGAYKYITTNFATNYYQQDGIHKWFTAPSGTAGNAITFTEAMTLAASGNLGAGATNPVGRINAAAADTSNSVGGSSASVNITNTDLAAFGRTSNLIFSLGDGNLSTRRMAAITGIYTGFTSSTAGAIAFSTDNGSSAFAERGRFDASGNFQVSNLAGTGNRAVYSTSTGILTNSSSDRTLKTDDQTISQGLDAVQAMRPVNFKWIDENRFGSQREIGFIAQEMQQIVPEVVGTNYDETLSVDYPKLTAVLVKAIQELKTIVDAQSIEIAALKNKA